MDEIIKVKTYALIRRGKELLLEPIAESDGTIKGYRPLGGSVEFNERSTEAIRREIREELGEEIEVGNLVYVSEEVFEYEGRHGHEVTFIYDVKFSNKDLYNQPEILRIDTVHHIPIHAQWLDPDHLPNGLPLFPADLKEQLQPVQAGCCL